MKYLKLFESLHKDSMENIKKFINSDDRNIWVKFETMEIYVRKSKHIIEGKIIDFLDLANFNIPNPKKKRKGTFTRFLIECNKLNKNLFIENVMNPDIINRIEQLGFIKCEGEYYGSFYKLFNI